MKAYLELRTSEGGQDAKLLVEDMAAIYKKAAHKNGINLSAHS